MAEKTKKNTVDKSGGEKRLQLQVQTRLVFGKRLGKLRREEIIPANIYGAEFKSQAIQAPMLEFKKIFKLAGETHIVYLTIEKNAGELPVLIQNVHAHPITGKFLHADFRKVDLKKKIQTSVPVKIVGESEVVSQNKGVLQTLGDTILVEALPDKIPNEIEINISSLKEVGDEIKVKQLKSTNNYIFTDDPEKAIVRIIEHKEEEIVPQVEEAAPAEAETAEEGAEQKESGEQSLPESQSGDVTGKKEA